MGGIGIKICLVSNYVPSTGGISGQVELIYRSLKKGQIAGSCISFRSNIFFKFLNLIYLIKNSKNCDIIHVHGCSYWGFLPIAMSIIVGTLFSKKTIVTYHGGEAENFFKKNSIIVKLFLRRVNIILVPSSFLTDVFSRYGFKSILYPNRIDINKFKYLNRKFRPLILVVKHLEETYDIETAIKAFSIVKKHFPMAKLKIVGTGSKEKQLKLLVKKLELYDVEFTGQVRHENISEVYNSSDIFLNTSLFESFGMVILEAFASGLVVISTNVGGIPDIIRENENGFLVNPGDYRAFAEKIIFILRNPDIAREISIKARQSAEKYDWENSAPMLYSIYDDVLSRNG